MRSLSPGTVWLDTARRDEHNRHSLLFENPLALLTAYSPAEVVPALEAAERARQTGHWVAGFVAYEAAAAWLPVVPPALGAPLVWFGVYDEPHPAPTIRPAAAAVELVPGLDFASYRTRMESVRALIREGDVYQVNLTFPMVGRLFGTADALYSALRARQPVPYGAFIRTDDREVLSFSPELFFRVSGARIFCKPMKGTAPIGATAQADQHIGEALRADPKSRAENLMIVDLLRNDLSRVCEPGSVRVPALFETERHPTLIQMTSTVTGRLREGSSLPAIFEALFPCGSVTGAPKHRAMQRIVELEGRPRGVYCGAIGYAAPHDEMAFSVPIRTLEIQDEAVRLGVGSGLVWDSEAESEYRECLLKARFATETTGG